MPERENFLLFIDENGIETILNLDHLRFATWPGWKSLGPVILYLEEGRSVNVRPGGECGWVWETLRQRTGRNLDEEP